MLLVGNLQFKLESDRSAISPIKMIITLDIKYTIELTIIGNKPSYDMSDRNQSTRTPRRLPGAPTLPSLLRHPCRQRARGPLRSFQQLATWPPSLPHARTGRRSSASRASRRRSVARCCGTRSLSTDGRGRWSSAVSMRAWCGSGLSVLSEAYSDGRGVWHVQGGHRHRRSRWLQTRANHEGPSVSARTCLR
jgi:hypothetical protein